MICPAPADTFGRGRCSRCCQQRAGRKDPEDSRPHEIRLFPVSAMFRPAVSHEGLHGLGSLRGQLGLDDVVAVVGGREREEILSRLGLGEPAFASASVVSWVAKGENRSRRKKERKERRDFDQDRLILKIFEVVVALGSSGRRSIPSL